VNRPLLAQRKSCDVRFRAAIRGSGRQTASPICDGVDAPPDGIDVPKWRC
jgi:hypothetical protein